MILFYQPLNPQVWLCRPAAKAPLSPEGAGHDRDPGKAR